MFHDYWRIDGYENGAIKVFHVTEDGRDELVTEKENFTGAIKFAFGLIRMSIGIARQIIGASVEAKINNMKK